MAGGLNLYSGLGAEAKYRAHLGHEQLTALVETLRGVRYKAKQTGPAVAIPRLALSSTGKVVYTLKTPYRDGTTQVAFEPVDFIARLVALALRGPTQTQG